MKDIIPAKKQSPILGLTGMGGGVGSNIVAGLAKESPYIEKLFNTYAYRGNATIRSINNGIDLSKNGGMVWIKNRSSTFSHTIFDTKRGATNIVRPNNDNAQTSGSTTLTSFNDNGFSLGTDSMTNSNTDKTIAWSFSKRKGFFDVVTWTGNATNRTIPHSLGCIPGCILIKRTDVAANWMVYHRSLNDGVDPGNYQLHLNTTAAEAAAPTVFNNTEPTSTTFSIGSHYDVNGNNGTFIAYVFAGGASDAATARSVDFDGSADYMNTPTTSDFSFGSNPFTIECWVRNDDTGHNGGFFNIAGGTGLGNQTTIAAAYDNGWIIYAGSAGIQGAPSSFTMRKGEWYHVAYVKSGTTTKLFVNGTQVITCTDTDTYDNNLALAVGAYAGTSYTFNGKISNLRVVKGTALYTSTFRPPTQPLTNITNTTMLCCNDSSTTGKTVGPALTAWGTVTASSDSPFDDSDGFKFGENEDQNIIKCGRYIGNGSTNGPEIDLGWEPQWLLIKRVNGAEQWFMFDCIRGIVTLGNYDKRIEIQSGPEDEDTWIDLNPRGFRPKTTNWGVNGGNDEYVYVAIRREDPLVTEAAESASDVFAIDTGSNTDVIPVFDSGFAVDFGIIKRYTTSDNWWCSARLMQNRYIEPDRNVAGATWDRAEFDSNLGWFRHPSYGTETISYMWKRYSGMDVVTYKGNGNGNRQIPHNLGKVPEMMWLKPRDSTGKWNIYHKGLNDGSNPAQKYILFTGDAEGSYGPIWNNTTPTATSFTVGSYTEVNDSSYNYIMHLFASVEGISKCGYYTGTGASGNSITTGFQPRFLIVKRTDDAGPWYVIDSTRGFGSGDDKILYLNNNNAQTTHDVFNPTSTGFTIQETWNDINANGGKYIYYAHA